MRETVTSAGNTVPSRRRQLASSIMWRAWSSPLRMRCTMAGVTPGMKRPIGLSRISSKSYRKNSFARAFRLSRCPLGSVISTASYIPARSWRKSDRWSFIVGLDMDMGNPSHFLCGQFAHPAHFLSETSFPVQQ